MALGYTEMLPGSGGSVLTTEEVAALLLDPLMAASVVLESGVQVIDASGVPVRVPKVNAVTIGADNFIAEGTEIPAVDPDLGELTLLGTGIYAMKTWTSFTNELLGHSNAAARIGPVLVRAVATALDRVLLAGPGTAGQPLGLTGQPDTQEIALAGALDVDLFIDAIGMLGAVNARAGAVYLHPDHLSAMRKLRDGGATGGYLLTPDPTQGQAPTLLGVPVYQSTHVPVDTALVVDPAAVIVARDTTASISLHPEAEARKDSTAIRVVARMDIGLGHSEGVVKITGITTA